MANISVNILIKWVNLNKIVTFSTCIYKSQNVAQSQQNFGLSHVGEAGTFIKLWKLNEFALFGIILNTGSCLK